MGETPSTAAAATAPATAPTAQRRSLYARARVLSSERPWVPDALALLITCVGSVLAATVALRFWEIPDFRSPIVASGDASSLLATFKGIHEHGWVWSNPSLGAPFGQLNYDYASIGPDNLHWLIAWVLTRVASEPGTVFNTMLVLTFPMAAAAAFAALRWLDIRRSVACSVAILFAVAPYHLIRGTNSHLLLADCAAVPLGVYLAIAVAIGKPLFRQRASGGNRVTRWATGTTARTLVLCLIIASSGIYYAAFALIFVVVATVVARLSGHGREVVAKGFAVLAGIGAVLVFNLLPTVIYHRLHGTNGETGQRSPTDSITFGLNLIGQVLPPPSHRLGFMRTLSNQYWDDAPLMSEGPTWGGTIATVGLLVLLASVGAALVASTSGRLLGDVRVRAAALIGLTATLLGATGAGGAFISYIINPSIRAWNRISVVIVFCSLIAIAVLLERLVTRAHARGGRSVYLVGALLPLLVVLGTFDQSSRTAPDYKTQRDLWANDAHYVRAVSASLGGKGEVYQLPYLPFPESPTLVQMPDYAPLRGYLHAGTGITWSYGAMKGRPQDWEAEASQLPIDEQIPAVALAGFDGVWVDTQGYANAEAEISGPLRKMLGMRPIVSPDGTLQFYNLRPLQAKLEAKVPKPEIAAVAEDVTHPIELTWDPGFYGLEPNGDTDQRWMKSQGTITIKNPTKDRRSVTFSAQLSGLAAAHVTVTYDGKPLATLVAPQQKPKAGGFPLNEKLTVTPGTHTLALSTDAPAVPTSDTRDLRLLLTTPRLSDTAIAELPEVTGGTP